MSPIIQLKTERLVKMNFHVYGHWPISIYSFYWISVRNNIHGLLSFLEKEKEKRKKAPVTLIMKMLATIQMLSFCLCRRNGSSFLSCVRFFITVCFICCFFFFLPSVCMLLFAFDAFLFLVSWFVHACKYGPFNLINIFV